MSETTSPAPALGPDTGYDQHPEPDEPSSTTWVNRPYSPEDEKSWLRCRALAFLDTDYYDDVRRSRPAGPTLQLVAVAPGPDAADHDEVIGILDIEIDGSLATIDTIGVHPDHRRGGIADTLLAEGLRRLPPGIAVLDAWTREDAAAHAWYRANGFTESDHYLHVYKGWDEPPEGWKAPEPLRRPVMAFCHADLANEAEIRDRFERVHVCRRFSRPVALDVPTLEP
ncbi:GNAT family N-acetyltransferase [Brachybacterium sp. NPDC056505]|uniref:GNAT family N-acetyltransferase n=1 Tax=Brachybacterium sp. NPDC056505 TaxID=3345843 RepID=UPI00366BB8A5